MIAGILALTLLGLAGALRAATASFRSGNRADALRDSADGIPGSARVAGFLEDRESMVTAVAAVHTILMVAATIPGMFAFAVGVNGHLRGVAAVAVGAATVLLGDLIPRVVGRRRPGRVAYRLVGLLEVADRLGKPLTELAVDDGSGEPVEPEDEEEELEMITSVMEFSETIVREVMVPRTDMKAIAVDAEVQELLDLVSEYGISRIPVVRNGIDDVVGVLIVKDLIPALARGHEIESLELLMRPVDFVPETKKVLDLLREMQVSKSHLAVVVDEFGATAGLVTIEDLLEELVGEIVDETDDEAILVTKSGDRTWVVDGRLLVSDLSELLRIELPNGDWDTVGGLVLGLAGRVPHPSESFEVDGVVLTVSRMSGRRVLEVTVGLESEAEDPE